MWLKNLLTKRSVTIIYNVFESRKGEPFSGILAKALERLKVGEDIEMLLNGIKKEFVYMEMNINNKLRGKLVLKQN